MSELWAQPKMRYNMGLSNRHPIALRQQARASAWTEVDDEATQGTDLPATATVDAQVVLAAIAKLPTKHRVVLALFAIEGLSHSEIDDILGVPEGTVWSLLHNARKSVVENLSN